MRKTNITDDEKDLLRQYAKTSSLILIRHKAQAVLMAAKGVRPADIGDILDRQERTVISWLRAWHSCRLGSLFTGHAGNANASKLSQAQREEIRVALRSPPSAYGLPKEFWDVPQLKRYMETTFGVVYVSDKSYHFLLKFGNLSFKYPATFDRQRDEAAIEQRMVAIRAQLRPMMQDNSLEVFATDEVKLQQEAIIRRAWLQKGARTVIKVNREKDSQSYIGFLDQKSFVCELYELAWQNTDEVLKAFQLLLERHPDKKLCVVWDNAPWHKSQQLKAALGRGHLLERVHLIALPPHAPDENPIEQVWNTAKGHIANIQRCTFAETKQAFADFIASRKFNYLF